MLSHERQGTLPKFLVLVVATGKHDKTFLCVSFLTCPRCISGYCDVVAMGVMFGQHDAHVRDLSLDRECRSTMMMKRDQEWMRCLGDLLIVC